jgi:hypothetical protein
MNRYEDDNIEDRRVVRLLTFEVEDTDRKPSNSALSRISQGFINYSKKHEATLVFLNSFISLSILIWLLVIALESESNIPSHIYSTLGAILSNMKASPLIDILPTNATICPANYAIQMIGDWAGTNAGCYCSGNFSKEACSDPSCQEVKSFDGVRLDRWRKLRFCVKRGKEGIDYAYETECPITHIQCSPGLCFR